MQPTNYRNPSQLHASTSRPLPPTPNVQSTSGTAGQHAAPSGEMLGLGVAQSSPTLADQSPSQHAPFGAVPVFGLPYPHSSASTTDVHQVTEAIPQFPSTAAYTGSAPGPRRPSTSAPRSSLLPSIQYLSFDTSLVDMPMLKTTIEARGTITAGLKIKATTKEFPVQLKNKTRDKEKKAVFESESTRKQMSIENSQSARNKEEQLENLIARICLQLSKKPDDATEIIVNVQRNGEETTLTLKEVEGGVQGRFGNDKETMMKGLDFKKILSSLEENTINKLHKLAEKLTESKMTFDQSTDKHNKYGGKADATASIHWHNATAATITARDGMFVVTVVKDHSCSDTTRAREQSASITAAALYVGKHGAQMGLTGEALQDCFIETLNKLNPSCDHEFGGVILYKAAGQERQFEYGDKNWHIQASPHPQTKLPVLHGQFSATATAPLDSNHHISSAMNRIATRDSEISEIVLEEKGDQATFSLATDVAFTHAKSSKYRKK